MRLGIRLLFAFFLINGIAAFFVLRVFTAEIKPSVREVMEDMMVDTANLLARRLAVSTIMSSIPSRTLGLLSAVNTRSTKQAALPLTRKHATSRRMPRRMGHQYGVSGFQKT